MRSRAILGAFLLCALAGCELVGTEDDADDQGSDFVLRVTARSATTLDLSWDAMPQAAGNLYTVDHFSGIASCKSLMQHSDVLHVTGTSVQLTGLTPATRYHIHVHPLPHGTHGTGEVTNSVYVNTLAAGAGQTPAVSADYETCEFEI
jgi:hypothetical protein